MRNLAIKTVISAAIRAFNLTVGLNRQEHARMAVPCFMIRARAMQRQILRFDDYNVFFRLCTHGLVPHYVFLSSDIVKQNGRQVQTENII